MTRLLLVLFTALSVPMACQKKTESRAVTVPADTAVFDDDTLEVADTSDKPVLNRAEVNSRSAGRTGKQ